jgi:hypothetical protein
MTYFEAFLWSVNNGWTRKELDEMKISEVKKIASNKTKGNLKK